MRRLQGICLVALTIVGVFASIGSAQAGSPGSWIYESTIVDDPNISYGNVFVNEQTGNLLVIGDDGKIHQFDASGAPLAFPATGSAVLAGGGQMMMANGGGATQGNFYLWDGNQVHSYKPDGTLIGVYEPRNEGLFTGEYLYEGGGLFVTGDGHLWAYIQIFDFHLGQAGPRVVPVTPELKATGPAVMLQDYRMGGSPTAADKLGNLY